MVNFDIVDIRPFRDEDRRQVLALLQGSLGWLDDAVHDSFFAWKHEENPFGRSPAWVAVDGSKVIGFRTFMRWRFLLDGRPVEAARAVDTATHPDARGRGVFSALTLHALDELDAMGVAFVFNTPNDQSRPGYLKMGWQVVGRLPVAVRAVGVRGAWRTLRARTPASLWSAPSPVGMAAGEAFADASGLERVLASVPRREGLVTDRSPAYLRWRYGFEPLRYRVMSPRGIDEGFAVFRMRRRGAATEAAICDIVVPEGRPRRAALLAHRIARRSAGDYALALGPGTGRALGFVPLPRQGPILTRRDVGGRSATDDHTVWQLSLGDVELF